ncbi:hypothetical protein V1478_010943 [Vespula squamosa]|uniref:Uncharacterized protein n=1 Tax=Vespula squamosa TaxID=30214 RepID=A0ABD2AGE8_VESSQ
MEICRNVYRHSWIQIKRFRASTPGGFIGGKFKKPRSVTGTVQDHNAFNFGEESVGSRMAGVTSKKSLAKAPPRTISLIRKMRETDTAPCYPLVESKRGKRREFVLDEEKGEDEEDEEDEEEWDWGTG